MQWVSKLSFKQKKEQKDFAVVVVVVAAAAAVVAVVDAAFLASQLINMIFEKKINIVYLSM